MRGSNPHRFYTGQFSKLLRQTNIRLLSIEMLAGLEPTDEGLQPTTFVQFCYSIFCTGQRCRTLLADFGDQHCQPGRPAFVGVAGIEPTIWCFTGTSPPKDHPHLKCLAGHELPALLRLPDVEHLLNQAEGKGIQPLPQYSLRTTVFKTVAFSHSANLPKLRNQPDSNECPQIFNLVLGQLSYGSNIYVPREGIEPSETPDPKSGDFTNLPTWVFCTPLRIRTETCTGLKPDASTIWATGA